MNFLEAINWEQGITSGAMIVVLLYLLKEERSERKAAQAKTLEILMESNAVIVAGAQDTNDNIRTLGQAIDIVGKAK